MNAGKREWLSFRRHGVTAIYEGAAIPDHPALPAVARWLAEDVRHVSLLGEIVAAAVKRGALSEEEDVRLHWLSSALTTEEPA